MKLVALDTSMEACSAALYVDGEIAERFRLAERGHADLILGMIDALMAEAELSTSALDALALTRGPGSFTGVRIAAAVAQGIAFARDLGVVPVSSLAALAQSVHRERGSPRIAVAVDARMGEVYWSAYEARSTTMQAICAERVCRPQDVGALPRTRWVGAGSAWGRYASELEQAAAVELEATLAAAFPHAQDVARLAIPSVLRGDLIDPGDLAPIYLRDQVVRRPDAGT